MTTDQITYADHALLVPSRTNRKNFNQPKLQALADTVAAHGIQQPLVVRTLPGDRLAETKLNTPARQALPAYEIVAGERRWLAAALAGLKQVPIIVRELTDAEALDIQLLENLARENLTALEEGEAFAHRMQHGGLTADQVGAKIGRSREYVYSKTKLLDLCPEAKDALRNDTIDASHALRIARIPDAKLQLKALEYATTPIYGSGDMPSVNAFARWLRQNVMLMLNAAVFKITDASLVASAGSCKDCMKRTGANPDLFSDVDGADICTDPPCFNNKTDTHRANLLAKAEKEGLRVIDGAEAKKICSMHSSTLKGYSPMSQQRLDALESGAQLGKLLGKDAPDPVLIENPYTKELIRAVPTDEAEAILLAKGLIKVTSGALEKQDELQREIDYLKSRLEHATAKEARKGMYQALLDAVRATPDDKAAALLSPALLRAWLSDELENLYLEDTADMLQVALDKENNITDEAASLRLQACDDATVYRAAAIYMLQQDKNVTYNNQTIYPTFDALASRTQTDLHTVRKQAAEDVKADTLEKIRELKAQHKAQQTPKAKQPPPQAAPTDSAKPTLKLRKQKLSGEQAQLCIAAAMQDIGQEATEADTDSDASPATATDPATEPWGGFTQGERVTVSNHLECLGLSQIKHAGKTGAVSMRESDGTLEVTFKGRTGGIASFHADQIS